MQLAPKTKSIENEQQKAIFCDSDVGNVFYPLCAGMILISEPLNFNYTDLRGAVFSNFPLAVKTPTFLFDPTATNAMGTGPYEFVEWLPNEFARMVRNEDYYGGPAPICQDAADLNDDGILDLADPIYGLSYLFEAGYAIPEPGWPCGMDPTSDALVPCLYACP